MPKYLQHSLIVLVSGLLFVGCVSKNLPAAEVLVPTLPASGPSVEQLAHGRDVIVAQCAGCHKQYWPKQYAPEKWPVIARRMGGMCSLTKDEIEDMTSYLVVASRYTRKAPSK